MRRIWMHLVLIIVVAGIALFTNLGGPRLWDRDEPRNAGCALEMLQRGDWVVPFFNGELRAHKPALLYWLIMSAYSLFGVNEFAARFWSAALGMGTALATYGIGRRLFHARVGLWSAVILSTSLMFDVAGRAATPDSTLIFFSTLSLLVYVWGVFRPKVDEAGPSSNSLAPVLLGEAWGEGPRNNSLAPVLRGEGGGEGPNNYWFPARWVVVAGMYALMGLAVLAKGPVGFLLPASVMASFLAIMRFQGRPDFPGFHLDGPRRGTEGNLPDGRPSQAEQDGLGRPSYKDGLGRPSYKTGWWRRRLACWRLLAPPHILRTLWSMRPFTAILVVAAVALPWYAWVGWRTDGKFLQIFFWEHNFERATRTLEGHGGSLLYYPVAILVGFFPWSVFAVPTLIDFVSGLRRRDVETPGYLLAGCWIASYVAIFSLARTKLPSYVTPCYPALALLMGCFLDHWINRRLAIRRIWPLLAFATLGLAGLASVIALPLLARRYLPGESWLGVIGIIPLAGAVVGWGFTKRECRGAAAVSFATTAVVLITSLLGCVAWRIDQHQQYPALLAAIDELGGDPQIGAYGWLEPSFLFYAGRPIQDLDFKSDGAWAPRGPWDPKPRPNPRVFFGDGKDRYIVTTDRAWQVLQPLLPPQAIVMAQYPLLFKRDRLLLLGR